MTDDESWMAAVLALIADGQRYNVLGDDNNGEAEPEEVWRRNPILKKLGRPTYDPKPLANMLRGSSPVPAGVRDCLAELLDPSPGCPYGMILSIEDTKTTNQFDKEWRDKWPIANMYRTKLESGMTVEVAAEETAAFFGVHERTVRRYNDDVAALNQFLCPKKT
jgi:hypothetical protein